MTDPMETHFNSSEVLMIRSPLLSIESGRQLVRELETMILDDGSKDVGVDFWKRSPWIEIAEAIRISSPSLYKSLISIALPGVKKSKRVRVLSALARYVARMSIRPTPHGLFAGVAPGLINSRNRLTRASWDSNTKHPILDWHFVNELVIAIQKDSKARRHIRYKFNPSVWTIGDRLHCLSFDNDESSIRNTAVTAFVKDLAKDWIQYSTIEDALNHHWPAAPVSTIESTIEQMRVDGFLVCELAPPLTGPHDPLLHIQSRLPADSEGGEFWRGRLQYLMELVGGYRESTLGEGHGFLDKIEDALSGLGIIVEGTPPLHVDLATEMYHADLAQSVADIAAEAVTLMYRLRPPLDGFSHLAEYRSAFTERYGAGREVPVLELLDPRIGLGPPPTYNRPPATRGWFYQPPSHEERDAQILSMVQTAVRRREQVIRLSHSDLETLTFDRDWKLKLPSSCDVFFSLANNGSDHPVVVLNSPAGNHIAGRAFGRFCHIYSKEFGGVLRRSMQASQDTKLPSDAMELVVYPVNRVAGNVTRIPALHSSELLGTVEPGVEPHKVLHFEDVLVGIGEDRRFYLRSAKSGRRLYTTSYHRFNRALNHNIIRFLDEIGFEDSFMPQFEWGRARTLPFLPRLEYKSIVIRLAQWVVPNTVFNTPHGLQDFLDDWQVPDEVYLVEGDNRLPVNLESPVDRKYVNAQLGHGSFIVFEEMYPRPEDTSLVDNAGNKYTAEFVLPVFRSSQDLALQVPEHQKLTIPDIIDTRHSVRHGLIGGECLFLKIYCDTSVQNEVVLRLAPTFRDLQESKEISTWFFVRYRDPEPHLRLRLFGDSRRLWGEVFQRLISFCGKVLEERLINDFAIENYRREVERYGGVDAIELVESIFAIDSELTLSIIPIMQKNKELQKRLLVSIYSALNFLRSVAGESSPIWSDLDLMSGTNDPRLPKLREKYTSVRKEVLFWFDQSDKRRTGMSSEYVLPAGITAIVSKRADLISSLLTRHAHSNESPVYPSHAIRAMIHMHMNRLVGIDAELELTVMYIIGRGHKEHQFIGGNSAYRQR